MPSLEQTPLQGHYYVLSGTTIPASRTAAQMRIVDNSAAEPTTYAEATGTRSLGLVNLTLPGDITVAAGNVSGRKATIASKSVTPTATGIVGFICLVNTTSLLLIAATPIAGDPIQVTSGVAITVNAWRIESLAPVTV